MSFTYGLGDAMVTERSVRSREYRESRAAWKAFGRTARYAHAARYVAPPIAPLAFPSSCVFCRGGYHHHAHFRACRQAPPWARRAA